MVTAIIVSFISGVTIVVSRTINAVLAAETNELVSTFYNYLVGLAFSVAILLATGGGFAGIVQRIPLSRSWIYLGGLVGVAVVFLSNVAVSKISSFSMTLLLFVGQIFTAILIDVMLTQGFSLNNLLGGICVAAGLIINVGVDRKDKPRESQG